MDEHHEEIKRLSIVDENNIFVTSTWQGKPDVKIIPLKEGQRYVEADRPSRHVYSTPKWDDNLGIWIESDPNHFLRKQLQRDLDNIDKKAGRALLAFAADVQTDEDMKHLKELARLAIEKRKELRELN